MDDVTITRQTLQRLFDDLQRAALLVQRLTVVARQQQIDASEAVAAVERTVATLQSGVRGEQGGTR